MPKGISEAAAAMLAGMDRLQAVANNLANIGTTGYKQDQMFVRLLSEEDARQRGESATGNINRTMRVDQYVDFSQGELTETENNLDFAISGEGFFVLESETGETYTRNGSFALNEDRILVDYLGNIVQGESGEIQISGNDISVDSAGSIIVNGSMIDTFRIVKFEDTTELKKIGNSQYASNRKGEGPVEASGEYSILQGYLENSNVNLVEEMVRMISLGKEFEMNQKIIRANDSILEREANEIGRIR